MDLLAPEGRDCEDILDEDRHPVCAVGQRSLQPHKNQCWQSQAGTPASIDVDKPGYTSDNEEKNEMLDFHPVQPFIDKISIQNHSAPTQKRQPLSLLSLLFQENELFTMP